MKAAYYEKFQQPLTLENLTDPAPDPDGVVIEVMATGLCRSDWHGWIPARRTRSGAGCA